MTLQLVTNVMSAYSYLNYLGVWNVSFKMDSRLAFIISHPTLIVIPLSTMRSSAIPSLELMLDQLLILVNQRIELFVFYIVTLDYEVFA